MVKIDYFTTEDIWFSHREKVYQADIGEFSWTDEDQIWDWDQIITINVVRALEGKLKVVIRRKAVAKSKLNGEKEVNLRFMLGFDIKKVHEPETDYYTARKYSDESRTHLGKPKWDMVGPFKRWFFRLDDNYWIWQKANDYEDIKSSSIYKIFYYLKYEIDSSKKISKNIFELDLICQEDLQCNNKVSPIIYQPSVDTMKNFIREIHCATLDNAARVEVTIIFNNEQLRKHKSANKLYEMIRQLIYGRTKDIETFNILINQDKSAKGLDFTDIYSGKSSLKEDSIHGDPMNSNPLPHPVRYFAGLNNEPKFSRPVIFINTSNHAMAEHDTNPRLWKWEYIPDLEKSAVKFKDKSRAEINKEYGSITIKKIIKRYIRLG